MDFTILRPDINLDCTLRANRVSRFTQITPSTFRVHSKDKFCYISQADVGLHLECDVPSDLEYFKLYFGFDDLYEVYSRNEREIATLSSITGGPTGVVLLRQDPWETLISQVIASRSNESKTLIESLCITAGKEIEFGFHAFPTPNELLSNASKISFLQGIDAELLRISNIVLEHGVVFEKLHRKNGFSYNDVLNVVSKLCGSDRVAALVLLFSLGYHDVFPDFQGVNRRLFGRQIEKFSPTAGLSFLYLSFCEQPKPVHI